MGQIGSQVLQGGFEDLMDFQLRELERRISLRAACICAFPGSGKIQQGSDGEVLGKGNCRGAGNVKGVHQEKASCSWPSAKRIVERRRATRAH